MPIADYATWQSKLENPHDRVPILNSSSVGIGGRLSDLWQTTQPLPGVTPTTAVALNDTSVGALPLVPTGVHRLPLAVRLNPTGPVLFVVCDRLVHSGGLNGTVIGAQTTNLPTPALPRYASGEGVMVGLTIYSAVGATGVLVNMTYTNSQGVERTSPTTQIGATNWNNQYRMIQMPLAEGDTGVQSVASVTLAASTGTAGNFGVTMFRPLFSVAVTDPSGSLSADMVAGGLLGLGRIDPTAHLSLLAIPATITGAVAAQMNYAGALLLGDD